MGLVSTAKHKVNNGGEKKRRENIMIKSEML